MDRSWESRDLRAGRMPGEVASPLLPSRAAALAAIREGLGTGGGPILLTGEPGSGKTWLWRRIAEERPGTAGAWISVDLAPSLDPRGLFGQIARALRLPESSGDDDPRLRLADELAERSAEGRRVALVLDEAHNSSGEILEEIRLLTNRAGRPDGFEALILVGLSWLARRIEARPLEALEARIVERVHLKPIDVEEARMLLLASRPDRPWGREEVEILHRDSGGNPRRLIRAALRDADRHRARAIRKRPEAPPRTFPWPQSQDAPDRGAVASEVQPNFEDAATDPQMEEVFVTPQTRPARPPLLDAEGVIEVGWPPEIEAAPPDPAAIRSMAGMTTVGLSEGGPGESLPIRDPYAAIQARREWIANHGTEPPDFEVESGDEEMTRTASTPRPGRDRQVSPLGPQHRAEGQHPFSPYSQLFSRARSAQEFD